MKQFRVATAAAGLAVLAGSALLWFVTGGAEAIQPPLEIVVPESVSGVVCATSRPGTIENVQQVVRHEVTPEGLLEVDGDVLRSHRPVKVLLRTSSGSIHEVSKESLTGIFTENDLSSGGWYTVMWFGETNDWEAYRKSMVGKHFCLGRFVAASRE
jgi:hypothetical protein